MVGVAQVFAGGFLTLDKPAVQLAAMHLFASLIYFPAYFCDRQQSPSSLLGSLGCLSGVPILLLFCSRAVVHLAPLFQVCRSLVILSQSLQLYKKSIVCRFALSQSKQDQSCFNTIVATSLFCQQA